MHKDFKTFDELLAEHMSFIQYEPYYGNFYVENGMLVLTVFYADKQNFTISTLTCEVRHEDMDKIKTFLTALKEYVIYKWDKVI